MGRRSFGISMTQINRMISASNAATKSREREMLIENQCGIQKEQAPSYNIKNFDFNETSRVSHVVFLESKAYRKIEKYVTSDGIRHPIYGGWNHKSKDIRKTLKLTNEILESLNTHEDFLIRRFSYEIITQIGNENFYPSWFIIQTLKNERDYSIDEINKSLNCKLQVCDNQIKNEKVAILRAQQSIKLCNKDLAKITAKRDKLKRKLAQVLKRDHFVLLGILTFGIYCALHSFKREKKLNTKIELLKSQINNFNLKIDAESKSISKSKEKISSEESKKIKLKQEAAKKKSSLNTKYEDDVALVEPLPMNLDSSLNNSFIPLKKIAGMNYEKIVGCYVIHNIEKDKYYVGQSKEVMKRVTKQHFDGAKPKNIIFAEDYFTSAYENKEDLFEVKIIRLQTKDELDRKERELIEEYDSFNNGYNGTGGND